jgi:hypothetical protein
MTVENAVGVEKVALADRSSKAQARMANLMIRMQSQINAQMENLEHAGVPFAKTSLPWKWKESQTRAASSMRHSHGTRKVNRKISRPRRIGRWCLAG